jgi:hypothetical protein
MPKLETPSSTTLVKVLVLGDSGTGKTGSLASLVRAGYHLHVLDFDNKIAGGILPILVQRDCPDLIGHVDFEPLRDSLKSSSMGPVFNGTPSAFVRAVSLLDKWSDGSVPSEWGPEHVLVVDSLTFLGDAAYNWAKSMNPTNKEQRQWYGNAQKVVEPMIAQITSASFKTNVVVIAHVDYQSRSDGTMKGFPASIGVALNPVIPAYFENMVLCHITGGKRIIQTIPTALVDLKNPAAFKMAATLPVETGLAGFFDTIKGGTHAKT